MKLVIVPGYKELFGEHTISYEELVKNVPSEIIISVLISLNNELNVPSKDISDFDNQKRLRNLFSARFTPQQSSYLNSAYYNFNIKTGGAYDAHVFARQYLLVMILKELNSYREFESEDTTGNDEFNLLIAYLLVIDEVNSNNKALMDEALTHKGDPLLDCRMLWIPTINQYEINEQINTAYELFRLVAFANYTLKHLRSFLKEYLNSYQFKNISELLGSFYQLSMTTLNYQKDEVFKKLNYVNPKEGTDDSHLRLQAEYSTDISLQVLERNCFQSLCRALQNHKGQIVKFDDNELYGSPDCYMRNNKSIMLFEFKGYIFPDALSTKPDFDVIKKYIDQRFVENENGKAKKYTD